MGTLGQRRKPSETIGDPLKPAENVETIGAKGGFFIEKVTIRKAATNVGNTWTKHVETRFVLRDMATNELQISGTLDRCFAHIDAKLLAA